MSVYEKEKALLGRSFKVKTEEKIGKYKMKIGDILTVIDYGSGLACHYVKFENSRLPFCAFTAGTHLFLKIVEI